MKFPGSNWWSFDFHSHTPASSDYDPTERVTLTPRDWLLACMRSGVDCVAVTDHNSGDWIDNLKRELATMESESPRHQDFREIHIFPGAELTTFDGIHVLAVYDPGESAARIHGLLALAKYNNDVNNANGMCQESALAICEHIHKTGGVVIFAHAEEKNGIFEGTVNDCGQFMPKHAPRSVDQLIEHADAFEIHNQGAPAVQHFSSKLRGTAIVDGSDAHHPRHVGSRRVWVKMTRPNIEGLKLALLDSESSLLCASERPRAPLRRIVSLRVENLQLRRQPLDISFSPWFNAIIGGRGSGKSTIIEALRLAMGRELDIQELGTAQESDVVRAFERFRTPGGTRVNAGMVRNETVLIATVEKQDPIARVTETYSFRWMPKEFQVHRLDGDGWGNTGLSMEQAAKFFPVKVFSQKQIFELAERPSALLTYIDRAPEVGFGKWKEKYDGLCRALRDLRGRARALAQAVEKKAEIEAELREVSRKVQAYQQSNISELFKDYRDSQAANKVISDFVEAIANPIRQLETTLDRVNPYTVVRLHDISLQVPDPSAVQHGAATVVNDLREKYGLVCQLVDEMTRLVSGFRYGAAVTDYFQETGKAIEEFRNEVAKLRDEGIGTAQEAEAALKRKQELEASLERLNADHIQLRRLEKEILKAYARLKLHRRNLTRLRRGFVNGVLKSNPNLRIAIDEQADVFQSGEEFRSILRLQEGTFVESILSTDEATGTHAGLIGALVSDGLSVPTHKRVSLLKLGIMGLQREILGQPVNGRLFSALSRLGEDDRDALLEWFPHDLVRVEFRRSKNDNFQSLARASAGQKTSSILSFLLSYGDEPLVIDQPEDDLDNALISELVVNQIRNNRTRRQIIVVTHNPNIVVNGDAELVLPMGFAGGQIQQNDVGGLQERSVRERICNIMEGGRDAFRQRYKRILEDLEGQLRRAL